MDFKLELVIVPVSEVDQAKAFYVDRVGFTLDVDHEAGDDFRVVQLTPLFAKNIERHALRRIMR